MSKYSFDWNATANGVPYITFSKLGISFNCAAIKALGAPDKVNIGFDKRNLTVGVRVHNPQSGADAHIFAPREKNGWVRIGCKNFIKQLNTLTGISFEKATRYIAVLTEKKYLAVRLEKKSQREEKL